MKIQVFSSTPVNWEITTSWMHPGENMSLVRFIFFSLSLSLPFLLLLLLPFCQVTLETDRDFLRDNSSAIYEETLKPFFFFLWDTARWLFPYFAFFASFIVAGDRMDARNTWEEDFHVSNDTAWNRGGFNGDLGIEFSFRLEFKKNEMRYMFF